MERKEKRDIARKMLKLEQRYQKAQSQEEKDQIEIAMNDLTIKLVAKISDGDFDMSAMAYIDDYIQEHLKVDNQKNI